ncbi:WD40 repeat-like protein [Amylocystis lapponica]|nr:WD40 repeat-like protein [Amylocystis lapponica]
MSSPRPVLSSQHNVPASEAERTPRFSTFYTTGLGSPFLTTSELPETSSDMHFSPPPASEELEDIDGAFAAVPRAFTVTRPPSPTPTFRTDSYSLINWSPDIAAYAAAAGDDRTPRCSTAFRGGPSRRTIPGYPYAPSPTPTTSPLKPSRSLSLGIGILPRIWDALRDGSPGRKGKRRAVFPSSSSWREAGYVDDGDDSVDYATMLPLDGEEGELIDDEACFIDVRAVTGIDIIAYLPTELALYLLSYLDIPAILACLRVSRVWHRLAQDNSVWCALFRQREVDGWGVDLQRARYAAMWTKSYNALNAPRMPVPAQLEVDWYSTYRTRKELDRRWSGTPNASFTQMPTLSAGASGGMEPQEAPKFWEPTVTRLNGHMDSVYCLEFDSTHIMTGSRDRTIKVWSLKTGACLATFAGHRGSVLCLKFDKDWDAEHLGNAAGEGADVWMRKGFMVSGSSDCSIVVWDLFKGPAVDWEEGALAVTAQAKAVLRGHTGGVLDLRIDSKWIVSCSKDALIRVWNRNTLGLHCTFRGHEGPVNAVGLQGNRVVSASGDGKMMLWDISTGERLRTFEGHDRGLACIEFKDDLIVSGSNDCKIKVWSAVSGACLRTLVGHDLLVRALSFDPRSGRLVSGSYDKTVKVWDLHTGRMVREFRGCHTSHIFDVKFDHRRIVSTSHDQNVVVLDFAEGLDATLLI